MQIVQLVYKYVISWFLKQIEPKIISGEEFDRMFDNGEDIEPYLDLTTIRRGVNETN